MKWSVVPLALLTIAAVCGVYFTGRSSDQSLVRSGAASDHPKVGSVVASVQPTLPQVLEARTVAPEVKRQPDSGRPSQAELAVAQRFDRLRTMPAGDAAIALGQQIEATFSAENARAYVDALLTVDSPAVERAAMTALARAGDGPTFLALAEQYGSMPMERRGRILQVLEGAGNPEALTGLATIVSSETHEKRSPLFMSAMYGMANIGTMDSVNLLLEQMANGNEDYALMALERVHTRQGVETIRSAAEGGKGSGRIDAAMLPALRRVAQVAASSVEK